MQFLQYTEIPWLNPSTLSIDSFSFIAYSCVVHHIPGPTGFRDLHSSDIDRDFPRAEEAFLKYIGTSKWLEERPDSQTNELLDGAPLPELPPTDARMKASNHQHDYEIIVGKYNDVNCDHAARYSTE